MNTQSISILGCGWLGLPLAQHLIQLGFSVKGSTTSQDKLSLLKQSKITPFLINSTPRLEGDNVDLFFQSPILFLNIPFRRNLEDPAYYKRQIESVIYYIESSAIEFVIFAGSTSIYPAATKEALEDVPLIPDNPRSKILQEVERGLLDHQGFATTVIRFAGLYGGNRQIGRILAGKKGLTDGNSPVNLVHLEDCVGIVTQIIQKDIRGEIINACSDGHPTRKEVYTKAALCYGLEPPQFVDTIGNHKNNRRQKSTERYHRRQFSRQSQSRVKIVSNAKLKRMLKYAFKHPNPLNLTFVSFVM